MDDESQMSDLERQALEEARLQAKGIVENESGGISSDTIAAATAGGRSASVLEGRELALIGGRDLSAFYINELVATILHICCRNNYANVTDFAW